MDRRTFGMSLPVVSLAAGARPSNLLWAAFGVNRESASFNKAGRTAPSASNSQEIDLYIALKEGVYVYEAVAHQLTPVSAGDFRARSGRGDAAKAPVNIFYIADLRSYDMGPGQPDRQIGDPVCTNARISGVARPEKTGIIAQTRVPA